MAITFLAIASKIAALAEITAGNSITMDNEIPNGLATQLRNQGLTVTRTNFGGLTSLNSNVILTTNTTLINKAINGKRITDAFKFTYLVIFQEEVFEGDMEEQFTLIRKGTFEFDVNEMMHYSIWKLTRVWVNQ